MALAKCSECGGKVSTKAGACPHCGAPPPRPKPPEAPDSPASPASAGSSELGKLALVAFLIVGAFGIMWLVDQTADFNTSASVTGTGSDPAPVRSAPRPTAYRWYASSTANVRARPTTDAEIVDQLRRGEAVYVGTAENGWRHVATGPTSEDTLGFIYAELLQKQPLPTIEIADWNWRKDPGFGGDGAVIWQGQVRNNSGRYVELVRVEFTSLDGAGSVVDTDFTYARGLAPGGTANFKGYATYYGTEDKGRVRIVQ